MYLRKKRESEGGRKANAICGQAERNRNSGSRGGKRSTGRERSDETQTCLKSPDETRIHEGGLLDEPKKKRGGRSGKKASTTISAQRRQKPPKSLCSLARAEGEKGKGEENLDG